MADYDLFFEIRTYYLTKIATEIEEMLKLEKPRRNLGFNDDDILQNLWEEYCIQQQFEIGPFYVEYENFIQTAIQKGVYSLPNTIKKVLVYIGRVDFEKHHIYEDEDQVINYVNSYNNDAIRKLLQNKADLFRNSNIDKYESLDLKEDNEDDE